MVSSRLGAGAILRPATDKFLFKLTKGVCKVLSLQICHAGFVRRALGLQRVFILANV
jgi:hypothetical protein